MFRDVVASLAGQAARGGGDTGEQRDRGLGREVSLLSTGRTASVPRVRASVAILLVAVACRGGAEQARPRPENPGAIREPVRESASTPDPWAATDTSPKSGSGAGADPWTAPAALDPEQIADEACPSVTGPYFYRIERAGRVSHVLGTRHIGVSLAKFPPSVTDALRNARLVVLETDPADEPDVTMTPDDVPGTLGPDLWRRYQDLVGPIAARVVTDDASGAMVLMMMVAEHQGAMLDDEIAKDAQTRGIPTAGLESSASQHALIDKYLDARMLRAAVAETKDRAQLADETRDDLREYCRGTDDTPSHTDEERAELLKHGYTDADLAEFDEALLYARNAAWIPKLENKFRKGGVFVAVGAAHLIGPRSVIALLEARGYRATRLPGSP